MVTLKRVGMAGLALAGVLLFMVPASAAGAGAAAMAPASSAVLLNVNITGSPAAFRPTRVTVAPHWNGVSSCTTAVESFTLSNQTAVAQGITSDGRSLGTLAAHSKSGICINTDQAGKIDTFGLTSNGKSKLKAKVT
jgi:hypothetical protein